MREILVQDRAFTEVKEISIDGAEYNHYIQELYKSEPPNYLEADNDIEIDLDSKETEQVREVFNNQLDALKSGYNQLIIDRLSQEGDGNINAWLDVLNTTLDRLKDPSFYGKTPKFYADCKRALEQILFALKSNSDLRSLKKNIAYVAQQLQFCGPGIFTTLMDVEYQLINNSAKPDLLKWLADLRRNILYQIAEEHIHKHGISGGNSIHVHFRFNQMAQKAGWAVPQTKKFEGLSDILSDGMVSIDDTTLPWLKAEFIKRYNHQAMIDTLVVRFSDIISKFSESSYDLYNPDTFNSFEVLVKPFLDNKVCKDIYDFLEVDDNAGKYRIKADFDAQLPQYCEALLVAEDFIDNPQKIIKAQAYSRGFLARREYQKQRDAATTIQTAYRSFWARNKYKAMKLEQENEQILTAHQEIVAGWEARNVITVDQLMHCEQPENLRILLSRPSTVEDLLKTVDGASIHQLLQMDSNTLETLIKHARIVKSILIQAEGRISFIELCQCDQDKLDYLLMHKYGLMSSLEHGWTFSSLIKFSPFQFKNILSYYNDAKEDVEECPPIDNKLLLKSAGQFDHWMKTYNHPERSDNEHLIDWLNNDDRFNHIRSYEALCQLAKQLKGQGYNTTNPPCTSMKFAAEKFQDWMKNYNHHYHWMKARNQPVKSDNALLMYWLNDDGGFNHIRSYEALCQLAEQLKGQGYNTTNPPCYLKKFEHAQQYYSRFRRQYPRFMGRPGTMVIDEKFISEYIWKVLRDTGRLPAHDVQGNEDPENNFNL